jgi:protocatechuate 3,4-dioxygenase beta subunit
MKTSHDHDHDHAHHQGLVRDLVLLHERMLERRRVLRWAFGVGLAPLLGCGNTALSGADGGGGAGGSSGAGGSGGAGGGDGGADSACATIPEETAGPYPGDGSNGPNALVQAGIVRSDIRSSFGTSSGTAAGVPLTVTLTLLASSGGCAPLPGYAIYLWHCDRDGLYSLYSLGVTDQNYLRGVQTTGSDGSVTFTTIFPGCYSGRWPHIHFEIYPTPAAATSASGKVATSQLALPQATCAEAYATDGYATSVANLSQVSLATDNVFSDGWTTQLPTMTGNATDGYVATLAVPID